MKLPNTIRIILTSMTLVVSSAHAHPGEPGHTHDEWPFPEIEWSMVGIAAGLAAIGIGVALLAIRRRGRGGQPGLPAA